jgi:hypothetical protein
MGLDFLRRKRAIAPTIVVIAMATAALASAQARSPESSSPPVEGAGSPSTVFESTFRAEAPAPSTPKSGGLTAASSTPAEQGGVCSIWSGEPGVQDCTGGWPYYYLGSGPGPEGHASGQFSELADFPHIMEHITPGSHVVNATLYVHDNGTTTNVGIPISVYGVTTPWVEATWLRVNASQPSQWHEWEHPGGDFDAEPGATNPSFGNSAAEEFGMFSWEPTKLVQEWVDGGSAGENPAVGRPNYGLILSDPNPAAGSNVLKTETAETIFYPTLDVEWEKETVPPVLSLSGSAVAAAKEAKTSGSYELDIAATDGSSTAPQSGVTSVVISVDGTAVETYSQSCPKGSCGLEKTWTYSPASYPGTIHTITVQVTDQAGNVTTQAVGPEEIPGQADGNVTACPASGEAEQGHPVIEAGPGGGSILRYTLSDGTDVEVPRPPAGFNVMTASNSELEAYGVQPRPAGGVAEEEWIEEYNGLTFENHGSLCGLANAGSEGPEALPLNAGLGQATKEFSGYYAFDPEHATRFTGVKGQYLVPTAGETPNCTRSAEASWVGLGRSEHGFMQAGTILTNKGLIKPFIQVWKKGAKRQFHDIDTPIQVHPGNRLRVTLSYSLARHKIFVTFFDLTTEKMQPIPVLEPLSTEYYDGSTVSWIEERVAALADGNLKNFGSVPWSHARGLESAGGGSWRKLLALPWEKSYIRLGKTVLAEPTSIGSTGEGFTDNFQACTG